MDRPDRRVFLLPAMVFVTLLFCNTASAATFTYGNTMGNTAPGTSWSAGTNWDVVPVSAANTTLVFNGALAAGTTIFSNNDNAGNFQLNALTFTAAGPASGAVPVETINGNPLEFLTNVSAPVLTLTTTGSSKPTLTINNNIVLDNDLTLAVTTNGTVTGSITSNGAAGLIKNNAGTLTLAGTNGYTGATLVNTGVLKVTNGSALGSTSLVTVPSNGELQLNTAGTAIAPVTFNNLTVNISGTGSGSSAALHNVAGFNMWPGTVNADTAAATTRTDLNADAGSLTISGTLATTASGAQSALGLVVNSQAAAVAPVTFSGPITGIGKILKSSSGSGVLTISGNSPAWNGSLQINGQTVQVADAAGVANGPGDVAVTNNGLGTSAVLTSASAAAGTLQLRANGISDPSAQTLTYANTLSIAAGFSLTVDVNRQSDTGTGKTLAFSGAASIGAASKLTVTGGNSYNLALGALTLSGASGSATLVPTSANLAVATVTGNTSQTAAVVLVLDGTAAGNVVTDVISDFSGTKPTALTKSSTSTWTLSGASTYSGVTTISGGILNVASLTVEGAGAGSTASAVGQSNNAASNLVLSGGTLQYNGGSNQTTDRLFTVTPAGGTIDASSSLNSAVNFNNTGSIVAADAPARTATASSSTKILTGLSNTGDLVAGMTVTGTGITTGATIASIDSTSQITLTETANNTTGTPTVSFGVTSRVLTLTGSSSAVNTLAGALANSSGGAALAINKTGTGTWALNGTSSYTGATNVSNGDLRGTGTLANSAVTANGGNVWPGTSIVGSAVGAGEKMTVQGLTLSGNAKLKIAFNTAQTQSIVVTGTTCSISGGVLSLGTQNATSYTNPTTYTILTAGNQTTQNPIAAAFGSVLGLPSNVTVRYINVAGAVAFPANRVQLVIASNTVTPVTLDTFTATAEGFGVCVGWHCVSEFQNVGFHIYRRTIDTTEWKRINPALIPGRLTNPDFGTYCYYDSAPPGFFEYKLESVGVAGTTETYPLPGGPVVVDGMLDFALPTDAGIVAAVSCIAAEVDAVHTRALSALFDQPLHASLTLTQTVKTLDLAREPMQSKRPVADFTPNATLAAARWFGAGHAAPLTAFTAAKVVYDQPGVLLIPQSSLPSGFDMQHLALQREGRAIPALAVTRDAIVVFGAGYRDDYTGNDALFIRPSTGPVAAGQVVHAQGLFSSDQTAFAESPSTVTTSFHDVYFDYNNAFRPYTFAPWFSSKYLTASATSGTTQSFAINAPNATGGAASLTVNLWSLTQSSAAPQDHALQVLVNGQPCGFAQWNGGNKMLQLTFQMPPRALNAGANRIDLLTPPLAAVDSQIAFLHSITCAYAQALDGSGPLSVLADGIVRNLYEASKLPGPDAWVVDARYPDRAVLVPYESQAQTDGTFKLRFSGAGGGTGQYLVVPFGMENRPLSVSVRTVKPIKPSAYLATGPSQFAPGVQPLLMLRSREGLRAQYVDQEQIFDAYNYGRYGPSGIQNAVRAIQPRYLLLLGRTTYDYRNYEGQNVDPLCPAFLVPTTFWAQATSDSMFGDLGRGYPEVAVGRLPVNNPSELSIAVTRILNYRGAPVSGVRVHGVADQADPTVADFPAQAAALNQAFPDTAWQPNYLGVTYSTPAEVTTALAAAANGGADWVVYIGHGNAVRLGNESPNILDTTSVQAWAGNVVFLQSTCTAHWMAKNVSGYKSIAIQALTQPQGGICASIGTSTYMNSEYAVPFIARLMNAASVRGARWGDALMNTQHWAWQQGPQSSFYSDLGLTEQLFGDPAMAVFSKTLPAASPTSSLNGKF